MPPDSILELQHAVDERASLSDQNVAILCQIVQQAETQSNVESHPFRALFSAYDHVLPQHGIDPAHDQIYLRFLFKLGSKRQLDETLFESFERFLEELEIQLEFVSNDDSLAFEVDEYTKQFKAEGGPSNPKRFLRRASFSAIHEVENDAQQLPPEDFRSRPAQWTSLEHERKNLGDSHLRGIKRFRAGRRSGSLPAKTTFSAHSRYFVRPGQIGVDFQGGHGLGSNVLSRPSETTTTETQRRSQSPASSIDNDGKLGSEISAPSAFQSYSTNIHKPNFQEILSDHIQSAAHFYHPSRSQLLRDVDTFQHYRIRAVAHDIVDRWCDAALQARNHREHLQRVAVARDTKILLHQAFEHWRIRLHAHKQAAETERYFERLQHRASRARDLYLLTKAFSHWRLSTEDKRGHRLASRQKVIAVKYFHAWRDYALEKQNEAREGLLERNFDVWSGRCNRYLKSLHVAQGLHDRLYIKRVYWKWFWTFCERRAPEWHDRQLSQRLLLNWSRKAKQCTKQSDTSIRLSLSRNCQRALRQWVSRSGRTRSASREAYTYSLNRVMSDVLSSWTRASRFRPLVAEATNLVDWRIAGTNFVRMAHLLHLGNQASKIDKLRNMRLRWTEWNDSLRCRTLQHRRDDRYLLEMLYRWVIAGRCHLMCRLVEQRLRGQQWLAWRNKLILRMRQHNTLLQSYQQRKNISLISQSMEQWTLQYRNFALSNNKAHTFFAERVSSEALKGWNQSLQRRHQFDGDVPDIREYFLLRRYIRGWRKMEQTSKKQKRRDAYVVIRRAIKMRLATQAISQWRERTGHVMVMSKEASLVSLHKGFNVGTGILDVWMSAVSTSRDQEQDATQHYQHRLMIHLMSLWQDKAEHQLTLAGTADANWSLQRQKASFTCLRKLRLRLIEIRSLQGRVENLKSDYERRRAMNKIRWWSNKAAARRREASPVSIPERPAQTDTSDLDDIRLAVTQGQTHRFVRDTHNSKYSEAHNSRTPIPGYLSTPSRRAARARALVQSTTPLGTPFQSRLRAQLNETPQISARSIFGKPMASRKEGFKSVLEESTSMPSSPKAKGER